MRAGQLRPLVPAHQTSSALINGHHPGTHQEPQLKDDLDGQRAIRVAQLAQALNMSLVGVYQAVRRGEIKSIRIGKAIRIPAAEGRRLLGLDSREAA